MICHFLLLKSSLTLPNRIQRLFQSKVKKPSRPPAGPTSGLNKQQQQRESADDSLSSSKSSSREQLNGSQSGSLDRIGSFSSVKSPLVKTGSRKTSREDKPGSVSG